MKKVGVLIMLVGFVALAGGGYLFLTDDGDKKETSKQENTENKEENKITEFNESTIKSYSEYTNYDLTVSLTSTTGENKIEISTNNKVDVKSNIIQTITTMSDAMSYYYYDVVNKLEYYSFDNVKWEKNTNMEMSMPDFSVIIDRVKNLNNVTKVGEGLYQLTNNIVEDGVTQENVLINVSFTSDGYLSSVSYTINDTVSNTSTTTRYIFSSINTIGDVLIPNEIVNGAIQGSATSKIDFFKLA